MNSTSEAYGLLDFGFEDSEDWQDDEDDDPYADEPVDDEDSEGGFDPRPAVILYRPSPVCDFAPAVRVVAERHRAEASELLNVYTNALDDGPWLDAPFDPWFPSPRPPRQRVYEANLLARPSEFAAVMAEWRRYRSALPEFIAGFDGSEARAEFIEAEHRIRDFRFLTALAGLRRDRILACWHHAQLGTFARSQERKSFYAARDAMRKLDPGEREAARARDAKRRKTAKCKERMAKYQADPVNKAAAAARKRAARAAKKSLLTPR